MLLGFFSRPYKVKKDPTGVRRDVRFLRGLTLVKDSTCRRGAVNFLETSVTEERVLLLQNAALPAHRASTVKPSLLGLRRGAKMEHAVTHIVRITGGLSNWQKLGVYLKKQVSAPARNNRRTAVVGLNFLSCLEFRQAHTGTLTRCLGLTEWKPHILLQVGTGNHESTASQGNAATVIFCKIQWLLTPKMKTEVQRPPFTFSALTMRFPEARWYSRGKDLVRTDEKEQKLRGLQPGRESWAPSLHQRVFLCNVNQPNCEAHIPAFSASNYFCSL